VCKKETVTDQENRESRDSVTGAIPSDIALHFTGLNSDLQRRMANHKNVCFH
jgi:hypothetical protein